MFFLLRVAFWLTIVLALLPSGGAQQSAQAKVGPTEAVVAASAAVHDERDVVENQHVELVQVEVEHRLLLRSGVEAVGE